MRDKNNGNIYFDNLLKMFQKQFSKVKNKRIVLYGIGAFTATVIDGLKDYNIVGLMDRDPENIGKIIYGVPVLSAEETEQKADLVIINTNESYWQTIYKRIKDIKTEVFFRDGVRAYLEEGVRSYNNEHFYWNTCKEELLQEIDSHKVISFDIFDTLITRRIYLPADVFRLTEIKLKYENGIDIQFERLRVAALHNTNKEEPDYDEIYECFTALSGLDETTVAIIKQKEIEIEKLLLVPRYEMVEVLNYAKASGKKIIAVSDMYYGRDILLSLLSDAGIDNIDDIYISSEYNKTKASGKLFDEVLKKYENILHIGDNEISDVAIPKDKGIDSFYIMSGRDILANSQLNKIIPETLTVLDSVVLGLIVEKFFNSPFAINDKKGLVKIEDTHKMGYLIYGPLIFGYISFLLRETKKDDVEKILFFSRDGYFLKRYYAWLGRYIYGNDFIEAQYFMISRRLAAVVSIENENDFIEVAELPYKGTFEEYMQRRWNIEIAVDDENYGKVINTAFNFDELYNMIKHYGNEIKESICSDKKNYREYCKAHTEGKNIAIVDTWYYGNCQYYLSKFLKRKTKGYYFGVNLTGQNRNMTVNTLKSCYNSKKNPCCENVMCVKNSLQFETIFTAPHGMVRSCTAENDFIYELKGKNQQEFSMREEISDGCEEFIRDIAGVLGREILTQENFAYDFCDKLYGICWNGGICLSKDISEKMYNENFLQGSDEFPVLE